MLKQIGEDIKSVRERDPAARNSFEVFLLYSGVHALIYYRISNWFWRHRCKFIGRLISQFARFMTGIEIHPAAKIGKGLFIDHGSGVVVGETTEIGDECTIYQGVTLGGTGKHKGKRHPTIGNNVIIGAGAKVLGPFTVGDNAKIAAGAVVLDEVPADCTAVGVPARIVRRNGKKVDCDMDQVHIPDPIAQELCKLQYQIDKLQQTVARLENEKSGK